MKTTQAKQTTDNQLNGSVVYVYTLYKCNSSGLVVYPSVVSGGSNIVICFRFRNSLVNAVVHSNLHVHGALVELATIRSFFFFLT